MKISEHDRVYDRVDPRHVGFVECITLDTALVLWAGGLRSILRTRSLVRVPPNPHVITIVGTDPFKGGHL